MTHQLVGSLLALSGLGGLLAFLRPLRPITSTNPLPEEPPMIDPAVIWNDAKALADEAIKKAFADLPGADLGPQREEQAFHYVLDHVEEVDQLLPVIGQYMDLPVVNLAEAAICKAAVRETFRLLVRQQYAAKAIQEAQTPTAPVPAPVEPATPAAAPVATPAPATELEPATPRGADQ